MASTIKLIIRVLPNNEDVDVDVPLDATAKDIIDTLLDSDIGQRHDNSGTPITYNLTPKGKNIVIEEHQTLEEAGIQEGDILLMTPVFVAG